jgi:two-component system, LytTR family, sensor kinase
MDRVAQQRTALRWVLIFISWSLIAIFFAGRSVVAYLSRGLPAQLLNYVVISELVYWCIWAPLLPLIFWFARRFPIRRKYWLRGGLLVVVFGLLITLFQVSLEVVINLKIVPALLNIPPAIIDKFGGIKGIALITSFTSIIVYLFVIASYYTFDFYQRYRARDTKATQLEGMLAKAELQNLKMQLHPHFLFNTLHTISVLITKDPEAANQVLIRLSDLLRMVLENIGTQEVKLREELEFLSGYLEIEQIRFRDRLKVSLRIEPDILDARVPSFILQPLVENAVRHGISQLLGSGVIEISGRREDAMIRLEIKDNGSGLEADNENPIKEGIGLSTTRARLFQLYGADQLFEVCDGPGGGVLATIILPYRVTGEQ